MAGTKKERAARLYRRIQANVGGMLAGTIPADEFSTEQRACWDEARDTRCESELLALVRLDLPAVGGCHA